MPPLFKLLRQFSLLLAILRLLLSSAPTQRQHPMPQNSLFRPNDLALRTPPLDKPATALTSHPKRAHLTKGTFYRGLWSLRSQHNHVHHPGPILLRRPPPATSNNFARQILNEVATRIATGSRQEGRFPWGP